MSKMYDKTAKAPRSEAQKEAARRNGAKSRGPVTPAGKATCARNALRHGLTAFHLALSCEDQDSFNMVLADYMDEYRPVEATETNLVERIAFAQWQMYRAWTAETAVINIEIETNRTALDARFTHYAEPVHVAVAIESSLARTGSLPHLNRCQSRINREYFQALRTLRAIRKESALAAEADKAFAETNPTSAPESEAAQLEENTVPPPNMDPETEFREIAETDPTAPLEPATAQLQKSILNPREIAETDLTQRTHSDRTASWTVVKALATLVFAGTTALATLAITTARAQPSQRMQSPTVQTEELTERTSPLARVQSRFNASRCSATREPLPPSGIPRPPRFDLRDAKLRSTVWQGRTEANLQRVLELLKAMSPIMVIVAIALKSPEVGKLFTEKAGSNSALVQRIAELKILAGE